MLCAHLPVSCPAGAALPGLPCRGCPAEHFLLMAGCLAGCPDGCHSLPSAAWSPAKLISIKGYLALSTRPSKH